MTMQVSGTSGFTFPDNTTQATAAKIGMTNRIINGDMRIWQRGTTLNGMTPSLGATSYTADRWFVSQLGSQSSTDVSQQTGGATKYSIRVQKRAGSSGASRNQLGQVIENLNCLDLPSKNITLQFAAKCGENYSATSNNLLVTVYSCTAANQSSPMFINGVATGQSTLYSGNVQLTTSNQLFVLPPIAVPSNATNICVVFEEASSASAAGTNDWFEISDVQIEKGSTATSFDYRSYGVELALCQRYYWTGNATMYHYYGFGGSWPAGMPISYPVSMRVAPTVTIGTNIMASLTNSPTIIYSYPNLFLYSCNVTASGTIYRVDPIYATAEL